MITLIKPDYLKRLDLAKVTNNPCVNCLLETEERIRAGDFDNVSFGDKIWYSTYKAERDELVKVLKNYNPKKLIEIGSGTGRIIKTVLDTLPKAEIIGIEKDERAFDFAIKRFLGDKRVSMHQTDISDYLDDAGKFDMAICLMNTFGNINDVNIFRKIVSQADYFVFSLYNRKFDERRKLMYEARGHSNFSYDQGAYYFKDDWINGLVSRSYTEAEINDLVRNSGSKLVQLKPVELLYFVIVQTNKS